ncbi:universal stress protein [Nocardioides mesophilus]|uniref:Universal stress protein n=1 Tax=Nocardioides mesophilus TaxID=433659 RepID=A0A7G9R8F3_9ACTN|nr:universal stress protein [Nocardioides mesophilus]QNN51878.1 universal stress protein [Nocardioides mesophilus]
MSSRDLLPIVVAVGDSDVHEAALTFATDQALREGRGVRLVHVVHSRGAGGPESMLLTLRGAQLVGEQLVHHAAERVQQLSDGRLPVDTVVRTGSTVPVLLEASERADRLVLQHRQQSRFARIFTGSTAAGVAERCGVPMVSVPESWTGPLTAGAHVTVAVDQVHPDEALLRHGFSIAEGLRGTLTVMHAWHLPTAYDDAIADRKAVHRWAAQAQRDLQSRVTELRDDYPGVEVRVHVLHMRPFDALLQASGHSDLLVVGRNRAPRRVPRLGSLTRSLIQESLCPVEVVPALRQAETPASAAHQRTRPTQTVRS